VSQQQLIQQQLLQWVLMGVLLLHLLDQVELEWEYQF
jgi:hypothetical protein